MFQSVSEKNADSKQDFDTVIGPLVKASGTLKSSGNVKLAGTFKNGEVQVEGLLEIAPEAKLEANIKAENVKVYGEIKGNIAAQQVVVGSSGKVYGDINAGGNLVIESGGLFVGKSVMTEKKMEKKDTVPDTAEKGKEG